MQTAGKDYIGVGVGGIILNAAGDRVLLARRGEKARNQRGQWENPGGAVSMGEDFRDALIREIREELGITVSVTGLLRVVNHIIPADGQHWVSPTFVCCHTDGGPVIREPEKCSDIGWFPLDALPEPMTAISETDLHCLRVLRSEGRSLLPTDWTLPVFSKTHDF